MEATPREPASVVWALLVPALILAATVCAGLPTTLLAYGVATATYVHW